MDELDAYLYHRHARPPRVVGQATTIAATDGLPLAATLWESTDHGASRVAVVASATGVKRAYYARFAAWLAAQGLAVLTFDYRGIGDSPEARDATMRDWGVKDLAGAVAWATARFGRNATAVIGHSVGGQLLGLLPDAEAISSAVTVASQSGDYRLWPMPRRLAMAALWYGLVPGVTHAVGYLPGVLGVGEDLPSGVALEWARWCRMPGYLEDERGSFGAVRAPILAFGFDDDPYAPPAAVDALHALYANARVRRRQVSKREAAVGHFGFFREKHRDLWREAATFLAAR